MSLPPHPPPESSDKTYTEARAAAEDRSVASMQNGAKMIGAYYKALLAETNDREFAVRGAERIAMIWERSVEASMNAEREKSNAQ